MATSSTPARPKTDKGVVIAIAWLGVAVGATLLFGSHLGFRGWCLLMVHHALCLVGTSHELWRGWRRHKMRSYPQ